MGFKRGIILFVMTGVIATLLMSNVLAGLLGFLGTVAASAGIGCIAGAPGCVAGAIAGAIGYTAEGGDSSGSGPTGEMAAEDYPDGSAELTSDADYNFMYAAAFGVSAQDQTDSKGCQGDGTTLANYFGVLNSKNNVISFSTKDEIGACAWKDLPAQKKGCYILAQEEDKATTVGETSNSDCGGLIVPKNSVIDYNNHVAKDFFPSDTDEKNYQKADFQSGDFEEYLTGGEFEESGWGVDSSDSQCVLQEYLFNGNGKKGSGEKSPPDRAYVCLINKDGDNALWYACDKEHAGKYIYIEPKEEIEEWGSTEEVPATGPPKAWFCIENDDGFTWKEKELKCTDEGVDCDNTESICTGIYGPQPFDPTQSAWNEQAGCCGNDGIEDLGAVSKDGTYLCSHEETLGTVSTPPEDDSSFTKDNIQDLSPEGWHWVDASEGNFKIRDLGPAKRLLSNGNQWFKCNQTNSGSLKENTEGTPLEQTNSRRFYCIGEEDHGWWKECLMEGASEEEKSINAPTSQAGTGDNIYTLYLSESNEWLLIPQEGKNIADTSVTFNQPTYLPESGAIILLFKFTENPFAAILSNQAEPKVILNIKKGDFSLQNANLLDYTQVPYSKENQLMKAYLGNIYPPTEIYSKISASILKVFYNTSSEGLLCSGKTAPEPGTSSWINSLDDKKGQLACEANGYTWTGKQCCEVDDYYLDGTVTLSDKEEQILTPVGCWDGITIKEGESIGEISFTINAQGKKTIYKLDQTYPCKKEKEEETCRYFIKGIIEEGKAIEEVALTNKFPEKYDLVARAFNEFDSEIKPKEILITNSGVKINRNKYYLEARKVPAVAILGKNDEGQGTFFSCGQDLTQVSNTETVSLCTIYQDNYCSAHGWTSKAPAKFTFDLATGYSLEPSSYEPDVLFNHSSSIVFGRNLIPNADFELDEKGNLKNWQKASQGTSKVESEKLFIQGEFISPPVYLEKDSYIISFTSDCDSNDKFGVYLSDNPATDSVKGPELNPLPKEYTSHGDWRHNYEYSVESGKYWLKLLSKEKECSIGELSLYRNQGTLTPFNYDALHQPITAQQCCPENSCWNGFTCAEDMSQQTEREETVAEGVSYRCLKGNWTAQEKKWDWTYKVQGYCEKETQCFVAPITPTGDAQGATAGVAAGEFYKGTTPSCVNDTEFIFDHYCQDGEWTTRTKFLIESLQSLAKKNNYPKYTLYCSPYTETLNEYGSSVYDIEQFIGGGEDYTKLASDPGCQFKKNDPTCQTTGKLCFSGANNNLVPNEENTCVNNFCLLTHEEDKQQKTIFAVSLNQPIDDTSNSFLRSLGIDTPDEIQSYCPTEGDDWVDCQNKVGFLKYHPKLNMVTYSSETFDFEPGTLAKIWTGVKDAIGGAIDFIDGLLGFEADKVAPGQLPEPLKDKLTTTAFTTCPGIDTSRYFSFFGEGKSAVACVWNNTLSASYYNFVTPICDYASHTLQEKQWWLAEEAHEGKELPLQGELSLFCDSQSNNLIIKDPNDIAFWWPQLTGRLRIN